MDQKLTQVALEAHIANETDPAELRQLSLAIIHSAYQLNDMIPNIELLFYKIFCSPQSTAGIRKGS